MSEQSLIAQCLQQINDLGILQANYLHHTDTQWDMNADGIMRLYNGSHDMLFRVIIKERLTRPMIHMLTELNGNNELESRTILFTHSLDKRLAQDLKSGSLNYVDTNGNIYINAGKLLIYTTGALPVPWLNKPLNRSSLLNPTSVQAIGYFLAHEDDINQPYRIISEKSGIPLGTIGWVLKGLRERGHIIRASKEKRILANKKELFEKWLTGYQEKLRPKIYKGTYSSISKNIHEIAESILSGTEDALLGGEYAASLMGTELHPNTITIHAYGNLDTLIKRYTLYPDVKGNITLLRGVLTPDATAFTPNNPHSISPIYIFAEISDSPSERVHDAAKFVYNKYITGIVHE